MKQNMAEIIWKIIVIWILWYHFLAACLAPPLAAAWAAPPTAGFPADFAPAAAAPPAFWFLASSPGLGIVLMISSSSSGTSSGTIKWLRLYSLIYLSEVIMNDFCERFGSLFLGALILWTLYLLYLMKYNFHCLITLRLWALSLKILDL